MILDFNKEAAKRNVKIKFENIPKQETERVIDNYTGEYLHNEDRVVISVEPNNDKVTLELYDQLTDTKYTEFVFDTYTLFLIVETSRRMFNQLENILEDRE